MSRSSCNTVITCDQLNYLALGIKRALNKSGDNIKATIDEENNLRLQNFDSGEVVRIQL